MFYVFYVLCYVLCILCLHLVILFCQMRRRWTTEDDRQLCNAVSLIGTGDWDRISNEFFKKERSGNGCSLRWHRELRPKQYKVRYVLCYAYCTVVEANSKLLSYPFTSFRFSLQEKRPISIWGWELWPKQSHTDGWWIQNGGCKMGDWSNTDLLQIFNFVCLW